MYSEQLQSIIKQIIDNNKNNNEGLSDLPLIPVSCDYYVTKKRNTLYGFTLSGFGKSGDVFLFDPQPLLTFHHDLTILGRYQTAHLVADIDDVYDCLQYWINY